MRTIQAIFFDAVGTLIHPEPSAPLVYVEAARRFGSRHTFPTITRRFAEAFRKQEARDRDNGWVTSAAREEQRWRQIVADVLDDVADPAHCFQVLYDHFAQPESWRCEAGADALFAELTGLGYRLGLASNFDGRLGPLVRALAPLQALGENLVISSAVGYRKPAPEFFAEMWRATGLQAASILYVGDDPVNDCVGATQAGMAAVLYDPAGRQEKWAGPRIAKLADVLEILT